MQSLQGRLESWEELLLLQLKSEGRLVVPSSLWDLSGAFSYGLPLIR